MSDPSAQESLAAIVQAAQRGDRAAMEDLVVRVLPGLRAYVRLNVGAELRRVESCSDVVQSACREVIKDIEMFRGSLSSEFRGWLFAVALHKIRQRRRFHDAKRRDVRRVATAEDRDLLEAYASVCSPSRHAVANEELQRVESAFERLPDDYRQVLSSCCIAGLPHRDVAKSLGRSEAAVRKLLSRARARLALEMATAPAAGGG